MFPFFLSTCLPLSDEKEEDEELGKAKKEKEKKRKRRKNRKRRNRANSVRLRPISEIELAEVEIGRSRPSSKGGGTPSFGGPTLRTSTLRTPTSSWFLSPPFGPHPSPPFQETKNENLCWKRPLQNKTHVHRAHDESHMESAPQLTLTVRLSELVVPHHLLHGRHVSACPRHWTVVQQGHCEGPCGACQHRTPPPQPALDPEAAVALIVPWPLSRDSICHPLLQPTRPAVPDHHHQRVPVRCVPSVVWPPQVLLRHGWRLSSWLSHLASMERPGSCRSLTEHRATVSDRPPLPTSGCPQNLLFPAVLLKEIAHIFGLAWISFPHHSI